ncbi:hypothetical protein H310_03933 [Aphanomyces invadans]|uniref:PX domain-containing protein n=1 Tax=Aphanomyces invadans TaxID=157072 RepID=A0A024UGN5_9STRA|nr:hypothetical protein H310_03933 [Aphanomyces invadans]ETW04798.1 hypothetical protein H310_03933 [Aphanomyces invadans]|eukprot:XP_008866236.1 hypothetical protein H310_03933 [Aphanomyces invadans]
MTSNADEAIGISVTGHLEGDGKAVRFYVEMQSAAVRFSFHGRYSELRHLHRALLHVLRAMDKSLALPPFPPKHVLEDMRTRPKITQREAELFEYYTLVATNKVAIDWLAAQHDIRSTVAPQDAPKDGVEFTPPQSMVKLHSRRSRRSTNQT